MKKAWAFSYPLSAQRRLWSDWADAQADLSLRWAHSHFVCFVMRRLSKLFSSSYFSQCTETNKMVCAPVKTQISLGICPVWSVFVLHSVVNQGSKVASCGQQRLWLDWADAMADLSLRWTLRSFCWFWPPAQIFLIQLFQSLYRNQQNDLCAQQRLRAAWASVKSDQSLRCVD